jgi:glycosyltransferase involved in cell wall biosynthesis
LSAVISGFKPLIVIAQGTDIWPPSKVYFNKRVINFVAKKSNLIHTWSDNMSDHLYTLGIPKEKIFTFPKGIDTDLFSPKMKKNTRITKKTVIISTRQLRKSYNHEIIFSSIKKAYQANKNLKFVVCGDGEYLNKLYHKTQNLQMSGFTYFKGALNSEALSHELKNADIYISMQPIDGVSASLLEAMSTGLFPIVFDNAANREWITHGTNGFLSSSNPTIMAKLILRASENIDLRKNAALFNRRLILKKASINKNSKIIIDKYSENIVKFYPSQ